jgi:hypothetical protein
MIESGWSGFGIEPNDTMAAYARRELGLQVETTSLEEITTDSRFDLISMVQVLPHLFDLRRALTRAAELTKPDGLWLIETWDRSSWFARIWGQHWHEYSPPSVLHFLTKKNVQRYAAEHGFVEIASGRPRKYLLGAHAKSLLHYQFGDSPWGWPLKPVIAAIPKTARIPYPSWDLFWSLFRRR